MNRPNVFFIGDIDFHETSHTKSKTYRRSLQMVRISNLETIIPNDAHLCFSLIKFIPHTATYNQMSKTIVLESDLNVKFPLT